VVKALLEAASIPDEVNAFFSAYLILIQKQKKQLFWRVKCGQCVELITLPPSVSLLSKRYGILNISQPHKASTACYGDSFTFLFAAVYTFQRINSDLSHKMYETSPSKLTPRPAYAFKIIIQDILSHPL
jgi:hypothetical protein